MSGLLILLVFKSLFAEDNKMAEKPLCDQHRDFGKSEFVVVLSGDIARFEAALKILENGKADKMLLRGCSMGEKQYSDGHQYINIAKQRGIKSEKIMITRAVHNTEQRQYK